MLVPVLYLLGFTHGANLAVVLGGGAGIVLVASLPPLRKWSKHRRSLVALWLYTLVATPLLAWWLTSSLTGLVIYGIVAGVLGLYIIR